MTLPSPPRSRIARSLSLATDRKIYMGDRPRTFPAQWKMEEMYQRKNQVIWHIKQGLDKNQTEIGRPKVTKIYYNTVAPSYKHSRYHTKYFV